MSTVYIALDTETGGIGAECSLLTAYFGFLDKDLNLLDSLDLAIKPNDGAPYCVQAGGLAVNGINIVDHDKVAITESAAGKRLVEKLKLHSKFGKVKLIPIGHNVSFDIEHVQRKLLSKKHWDQHVSYRKLDTGTIAQFLKFANAIPDSNRGSLEMLAELYGVSFKDRAHTASSDALMCVDILKKMKLHVKEV